MAGSELISVVICTYNRAGLARQAIASVLAQDFPHSKYELIVVDNASTDSTGSMAKEFCDTYPSVRYFLETNLGLAYARNRGWQEAHGEYVAYIDDDCKVPPAWLSAAFRMIEQVRPAAFGGPYYAFYDSPKPAWFKDEYGSHVQSNTLRPLQAGEYLDGGNMFLRLDVLQGLGGFNTAYGMKGSKVGYGEETELIDRLHTVKDYRVYYSPNVFVYHLVSARKMKLWTNARINFLNGYYFAKIADRSHNNNRLVDAYRILKVLIKIVKSLTWDLLIRNRQRYPLFQNYCYEVSFQFFEELGHYLGR
ncbi:MAG TPA: glycosyltransferase family 2 protein [Anaerolineales bacterium]|nr:glycosyltransferase family 2 protein [Anaerolineales bacterium]